MSTIYSTGGQTIVATGVNLSNANAVFIGAVAATSFVATSPTSLSCVVPAGTIGAVVDVTIQSANGTSATSSATKLTYIVPPPTVTGLNISSGFLTGGIPVVISGTQLSTASSVKFGSVPAASFTYNSSTGQITAISPSTQLGTVDIVVSNSSGSSTASSADQFSFVNPPPIVTGLGVTTGSTGGGTSVTITGSRFIGATSILFGTVPSTSFSVSSDGSIVAIAPAQSAGTVSVTVVNNAGTSSTSAATQFIYLTTGVGGSGTISNPNLLGLPVIDSLDTLGGSAAGGTTVKVFGTGFSRNTVTGVKFGTVAATSFTILSDNAMTVVSPAESAGTVNIILQTANGNSAASAASQFTFTAANAVPTVSGVSLSQNSNGAGSFATIQGSGFSNGVTGVSFGGQSAVFIVQSPTQILALTPSGVSGSVNVTVTNSNGSSSNSSSSQVSLSANPLPRVTSTIPTITSGDYVVTSSGLPSSIPSGIFGGTTGPSATPTAPSVPLLHPVTTVNATASSMTSTTTDSETVPLIDSIQVTTQADGSVLVTEMTSTETFTYASSMTGGSGTTSYSSLDITLQITNGLSTTILAAHGTGDTQFSSTTITGSWHSYTSGGVTTYSTDSVTSITSTEFANGMGSVGGTDHVTVSLLQSSTAIHSSSGTISSAGVVTGQFLDGGSGSDSYADTDTNSSYSLTTTGSDGTSTTSNIQYSTIGQIPVVTGVLLSNPPPSAVASNLTATIIGNHFTGATAVLFGNVPAVSFQVLSDRSIKAVAPIGTPANGHVTVVGPTGSSTTSNNDQFSATPSWTSLSSDMFNGTLSGIDHWASLSSGTFTLNANGSQIVADTYSGNSAGNDTYSNSDTSASASLTTDATGSATLFNTSITSDTGFDEYFYTGSGTLAVAVDGTRSSVDAYNNTDDGHERYIQTDQGWVQINESVTSGTGIDPNTNITVVNFHDNFSDSSDDQSTYTDSDILAASTANGGTDKLNSSTTDNVTFGTTDTVAETDTQTNTYGTPTIMTSTDANTDSGVQTSSSTSVDNETLGVGEVVLSDAITFASPSSEHDTSTDVQTIVITTNGQVGVGDVLNATETFTSSDTSTSTDAYDDPGTMTITPTSYAESDQMTDTSTNSDSIQSETKIVASEAVTSSDGTSVTTAVNNDDTDVITDSETLVVGDFYTETSGTGGSNDVANNDATINDHFTLTDSYAQNDFTLQTTSAPVTNGTALLVSSARTVATGTAGDIETTLAESNTANVSVNFENDTSNLTNVDNGTSTIVNTLTVNVTDPVTGMVTQIGSGDLTITSFYDDDGDSTQSTTPAGSTTAATSSTAAVTAPPTITEQSHAISSGNYADSSTLSVSVQGSPSPGVTIDFLNTTASTDSGSYSINDQMTSPGVGIVSEIILVSSQDSLSINSLGHSNTTVIVKTDDGHGNTVNANETDKSQFGMSGIITNSDGGQLAVGESSSQITNDAENDTNTTGHNLTAFNNRKTTANDITTTINPTTGLQTTTTYIDNGSADNATYLETGSLADAHSMSLTNSGTDVVTGNVTFTTNSQTNFDTSVEIDFVGTASTGQSVNLVRKMITVANAQTTGVTAAQFNADGTQTVTGSLTGTSQNVDSYSLISGTVSSTDASTGITTKHAITDVVEGNGSISVADTDTKTISASGTITDTPNITDSGQSLLLWSFQDTATQTNSSGNPVNAVTSAVSSGSDARTDLNGIWSDLGVVKTSTSTTTVASATPPPGQHVAAPKELINANNGQQVRVPPPGNGPDPGNPAQIKPPEQTSIPVDLLPFNDIIPSNATFLIFDNKGNFVGVYNMTTKMIEKTIDGVTYQAPLSAVKSAFSYWYPPKDDAEWNTWFTGKGSKKPSSTFNQPDVLTRMENNDLSLIIKSAQSNSPAAWDPNISVAESSTLAGPLVVKMFQDVAIGIAIQYGGGAVVSGVVKVGGKILAKVSQGGKEFFVELTEATIDKLKKKAADKNTTAATSEAFNKFLYGCFVAGTLVHISAMVSPPGFGGFIDRRTEWETSKNLESESTIPASLAQAESILVPIESVQLGSRVTTSNPRRGDYDYSLPDPDESSWVRVTLKLERQNGSIVDAELLRPQSWVDLHELSVGKLIPMLLEELQVCGTAKVVALDVCPPLADGDGEVITGRFVTRQVHQTLLITLSTGTTLEGTPVHQVWSPERENWIPLGDFGVGDTVTIRSGFATVDAIDIHNAPVSVYNLEVHGEHVYEVTTDGILVHNTSAIGKSLESLQRALPGGHVFESHAYEWFGAAKGFKPSAQTVKQWTDLLDKVGKSKNKFKWSTGADETVAHLAKVDGKWFVVQYYKDSGVLATAFIPNRDQLQAMFKLLGW